MTSVRWESCFTKRHPTKGASEAELQSFVTSVFSVLSDEELASITASQSNPFPVADPLHAAYSPFDPRNWQLPGTPLPASYLDFLRWSDGGSFRTGDRVFDPIIAASRVRSYLLGYNVPQYMPGSVPFAFDGCGRFYLFDMREGPIRGEYPILFAAAGSLRYATAAHVGTSFLDALTQPTNPAEM